MAYIGNTQQNQNYVPAIDYFSGNGSTTAFTLSRPVASVAQVQAVIENVPQNPGDAYTVSGNTITFTSAPPSGTNNIYVYYTSPNTQVTALPQSPVVYGNLNFGSTGARIQGDFSNATLANRVAFQTSTTNGATAISAIPNGTGTSSFFAVFPNSDPSNTGYGYIASSATEVTFRSVISGTGSYLPMTFYTGGSERMRIDTSGNVGIGTSSPTSLLQTFNSQSSGTTAAVQKWSWADASNSATWGLKLDQIHTGSAINYSFRIRNNSTTDIDALYLQSTGNVGIGTSSPSTKLEVYGQRIRVNATPDPGIEFANTAAVKGYVFYDTTNDVMTMRHASSTGISVGASGQLGIGGANYGSSGQVLTSQGSGAAPVWASVSGGVTSLNGQTGAITNTDLYAIGSYITGRPQNTTTYAVNSTIAGSSLYSTSSFATYNASTGTWVPTSPPLINTGTWRCVSPAVNVSSSDIRPGLWVRIS